MTAMSTPLSGEEGMVSEAVVQMTSLRVLHRKLTVFAAMLERAGQYLEAAAQWHQAELHAPGEQSQLWCEARRARCLRMAPQEAQSYGQASRQRTRKSGGRGASNPAGGS